MLFIKCKMLAHSKRWTTLLSLFLRDLIDFRDFQIIAKLKTREILFLTFLTYF